MGEAERRRLAAINNTSDKDVCTTGAAASTWPLSNVRAFQEVQHTLNRHNVDYSRPGFHDSAAFLSAEKAEGSFIDNVARLVEARTYSTEELASAAVKVRIASEAVNSAVEADGRHGLCVIASGVLSRMLDALGVWNYCAKSTMTISFPESVSRSRRYFYAIDEGEFTAPHAIVVAPPYTVIDVTAKHQPYDVLGMAESLPRIVMSKTFNPYTWSVEDIVAPSFRELNMQHRAGLEAYLRARNPQMLKTMNVLHGRQVLYDRTGILCYVIVGVGGYAEPLEDLHVGVNINERRPIDIFNVDVLPRVNTILGLQ